MIVLTFITTSTIMYLHPIKNNTLGQEKLFKSLSFLTSAPGEVFKKDEDIHTIDNETLNHFIAFYSDKSVDSLEIFEKEEIRYILESMGKYNTRKLKKLLLDSEKEGEKVLKLLSENLFDEQLLILDEMLK